MGYGIAETRKPQSVLVTASVLVNITFLLRAYEAEWRAILAMRC